MSERVKTAEVRQRLGDLLDRVVSRRDAFVIERRGKPLAALVPFAQYQRLREVAEHELSAMLDRHARHLTQQQAEDLARRAVKTVAKKVGKNVAKKVGKNVAKSTGEDQVKSSPRRKR
jgi:prevent-host-death family protein